MVPDWEPFPFPAQPGDYTRHAAAAQARFESHSYEILELTSSWLMRYGAAMPTPPTADLVKPLRRTIHHLLAHAETDPENREEYRSQAVAVAVAVNLVRGKELTVTHG